ncbi:MAG: FG-GAP-like repeat-containing protein, partial [Cytophagales bacterium]|nr:FG-GAP-like repeat-containing protein [Cytophagales bacterium]
MKKIYPFRFYLLLVFTILSISAFTQEICDNGIDDDGDGFIDCVDGDCELIAECDGVLPCNNSLYQVISGVLKIFDPVNSSYQDIGSTSFGSYNGAGYNVQDGYIYAIKNYSGKNHMLKIDAYGDGVDLGSIANWTGISYCADVDKYGNWIAFTSGNHPQLRIIDLDRFPLQMTFQPLRNLSGTSIPNTADITYNPVQEKYYGMSKNFELVEIDPLAMTIDIVWNENLSTNNFGAAWSDSEGNSYFSNNATGEISRVRFDQSGNPLERVVVAYGEITNNNDGMNCTLSLPPFETNCSDGIDNDGDGFTDGEDPDCAEAPPLVEITNDPVVNVAFDSWGITAIDYNQDGYDDIFVPAYDPNTKSKLYLNDGTGQFTEHRGDALANDLLPSIGASWGDFDNDGQVDLALANNNGAPIKLYRNSNQSFSDQSAHLEGLTDGYSHNICFVDYDRDGWLDLFVSDYFSSKFNQLYRSKRDGTMERVYGIEVVEDATNSIGVVWADVNNDGWSDCFVPNYGTGNFLYLNQQGTSFTKIDMGDSYNSVGASFGDF